MQARDVMTEDVVSVNPETRIKDIAKLLLDRNISAAPVVDETDHVVGIVSEADLMRRLELGTEPRHSRWLGFFVSSKEGAAEYAKTHGVKASQVMTRNPLTVTEETSLGDIAATLEKNHIKRVPVLRDGRLVGIVSRSNLLQGLVSKRDTIAADAPSPNDQTIHKSVLAAIKKEGWVTHGSPNVIVSDGVVSDGVVDLSGFVDSAEEREAMIILVEGIDGVTEVVYHLGKFPLSAC